MASGTPVQVSSLHSSNASFILRPRNRLSILVALLLFSVFSYIILLLVASQLHRDMILFIVAWAFCFLCYLVASVWILTSKPTSKRFLWYEIGVIFVGAIIFRVMLINLSPGLSPDAWRYLWDARMIVYGYSPYQYAPNNPILVPLHNAILTHADYRGTPTKYPPGAEFFFVLGYLLSPTNLIGLKSLFILCDLVTCVALMTLLTCKGRDPRYALLYAWCPLPIVEFAIESHIDAVTITFSVLAVLCAVSSQRHVRILAGVMIGLATLTKLYPIVLLLVLVRRRDWGLLVACVTTIVLGYMPFVLLGQGHLLGSGGPIAAISSQGETHLGVVQMVLSIIGTNLHIKQGIIQSVVYAVEGLIISTTLVSVVIGRLRRRMSIEVGVLLLTWVTLATYAHVFPWYVPALLPWIALSIVPLWTEKGPSAKGLMITVLWYFTFTCILSYIPGSPHYWTQGNWLIYYGISFGVVLGGLLVSLFILLRKQRHSIAIEDG